MLVDLPFDVQLHIFRYLDSWSLYRGCLVAGNLNEAASRVLYMEFIWKGGCCERQRNTTTAAFNRRPYLVDAVRQMTFIAGVSYSALPPPMVNLKGLTFARCNKCQREWEDTGIMHIIQHFHDPSIPKKVSVCGAVLRTGGMEDGIQGVGFLDEKTTVEDTSFWPYLLQSNLVFLDVKSSISTISLVNGNINHLRGLKVQVDVYIDLLLGALVDMHSLSELVVECTLWIQIREQWTSFTCNLPSLTTIRLEAGQSFIGEEAFKTLCELFQCITCLSFALENVYLGPTTTPPRLNPPFPGDLLVKGILERNERALRSLNVSAAFVSADVIIRLLTEYPRLEELHLSSSRSDLYTISDFLPHASSLRELHLSLELPEDLSDPYPAIEELLATPSSLRQLNVYIPVVSDWGDEFVWMRTWEYDPKEQGAVLVNTGPWMVLTWTDGLATQYAAHQSMLLNT